MKNREQMNQQNMAAAMQAIAEAAQLTGVDGYALAAIAASESNLNANAWAKTSNAQGLFQFMPKTWDALLVKYGAEYGLDRSASRLDARASALMAGCLYKESQKILERKLDRPVTLPEMKVAHVLGVGAAAKFLKNMEANPGLPATAVVSKSAVKANHGLFYNLKTGIVNTLKEVFDKFKLDLHVKLDFVKKNFSLDLTIDKPGSEPERAVKAQEPAHENARERQADWSWDKPMQQQGLTPLQPDQGMAF